METASILAVPLLVYVVGIGSSFGCGRAAASRSRQTANGQKSHSTPTQSGAGAAPLQNNALLQGTGGIPWRRLWKEGEFRACYIGVSFYRDLTGQQLWTSAAQMFDE